MKNKIRKILLGFLIFYGSVVGGLYFAQRAMIYFPLTSIPDVTPYEKLGVTQIITKNSDNIDLVGWLFSPDQNQETIVIFHGNASSIRYSIGKALPYINEGYGVLLASYRGYDGNDGKPSEKGFYSDARSWIQKLQSLGVTSKDLILYGESIGTGVVVQMASEFSDVKAVILESPYTSLPDVAAKTYPFVPVRFLMKDKFNNLSKIKWINAPLFVIQGGEDQLIPPEISQALFDSANEPKDILKLEGYGHNDMPENLKYPAALNFLRNLK